MEEVKVDENQDERYKNLDPRVRQLALIQSIDG